MTEVPRGPSTELTPSPSLDLLREIARAGGDDDRASDLVGTRVGRYEVERVLGSGGMGVVYAARDTTLDRTVALKLMRGERMHDPERKRRFLIEAKLASSVNHPNVATVYDAGVEEGVGTFIAMELCEGENLRGLGARGELTAPEIARIGIEIARGLAAAHARGVIHRDLKPDNVMVGPDGRVKVLDFGVAKSLAHGDAAAVVDEARAPSTDANAAVTVEGHVLGTPTYMSPEQARGEAVDVRSDVYSLGVVLDELARRTPRTRASAPSDGHRRLPGPLGRVIARCLEPAPSQRFGSADEVARALEAAARPSPRRWLPLAGVVALGAAAAAAIAWPSRPVVPASPTAPAAASAPSPAMTALEEVAPAASLVASPSQRASASASSVRPAPPPRVRGARDASPRASSAPSASTPVVRRALDPLEDQK